MLLHDTYIFAGCNLIYVFSVCEDNVLPILSMLTFQESKIEINIQLYSIVLSSILLLNLNVSCILGSTLYKGNMG